MVDDIDNDGAAEIISSSIFSDTAFSNAGTVSIVEGGSYSGSYSIDTADIHISGLQSMSEFGTAIETGDINNDGLTDLLIGAPYADAGFIQSGMLFGFLHLASMSGDYHRWMQIGRLRGFPCGKLGRKIRVGDRDGNGSTGVMISVPNSSTLVSGGGQIAIFEQIDLMETTVSDADRFIQGTGIAGRVGTALSFGDIDGDGEAGIVLSSLSRCSWLVFGRAGFFMAIGCRFSGS